MKYLISFLALTIGLNAGVYYAKVDPVQEFSIKASARGKVVMMAKEAEGRVSKGGVLIQIDDVLNKKELVASRGRLESLKRTLVFSERNLENSKKVAQIREENYQRIKSLKTKSKSSKDNELISSLSASSQVLSLKNSLEALKVSISDLGYKIASLQESIANKKISIKKGFFIYKTYVDEGDYVNIGSRLVDVYDISRGKLTLYLSKEDVKNLSKSVIFVDGKATALKVDKIWKVVDTQNISSYQTQIIVPAPKRFSQLVKIEFRN